MGKKKPCTALNMPFVGIRARRWHPGTSLASGHVGGTKRILQKTRKNDFFQKKQRKNFAACEICRTFAPSKKITYLGLRIGCIPLTLVGITDCGSNPHMHAIDNYF